jgi:molybdopterin molybdotransferase
VTFELFVVPALDLLGGAQPRPLALLEAELTKTMNEKPGLTHFLPARVEWPHGKAQVKPVHWQGSGDIATLAKANCFLVVPSDKGTLAQGEHVSVMMRRDLI